VDGDRRQVLGWDQGKRLQDDDREAPGGPGLGPREASRKTQGTDFIAELEQLKASGDLGYVGKGTLGKGQPWAYIYRGRGLTLVQRQTGEFWTLLETGAGKDLAIQITEAAIK